MISEVARRYARAFFELSKAAQTLDIVFSELRTLRDILNEDQSIQDYFTSPVIAPDQKISAIKAALSGKISSEVLSALLLLAQKNRLGLFSEIVEAFESINDDDHGVTRGTVRSATVLSGEARQKLQETVSNVTKKKVILNFTEDPKLMGGMVAQVGGWTFDDSLETHLTRMSEELNRRSH